MKYSRSDDSQGNLQRALLETRRAIASRRIAYPRYAKIYVHQLQEQKDECIESIARQTAEPVLCSVVPMSLSRSGMLYLESTRTRSHFPGMDSRRNGNFQFQLSSARSIPMWIN